MGNIRNFKGIRNVVLNFDFFYLRGKFTCYKIMQVIGIPYLLFVLLVRYKEYCMGKSYYPECERKNTFRIFFDQLGWIFRKGELNNYYYLYGMDRKDFGNIYSYVGEINFTNARRRKNEVRRQWKFFNASVLLLDKFYFASLLESLGYNTPHVKYFINDSEAYDVVNKHVISLEDMFSQEGEFFVKSTIGGGGKDEDNFLVSVNGGEIMKLGVLTTSEELLKPLRHGRWIIQERIKEQHKDMAKFHPCSLNTLRLITVAEANQIIVIAAFVKFGQDGRFKDNAISGGVAVPVNIHTGELEKYGYMLVKNEKVLEHPNTHVPFEGFKIPMWDLAVSKAMSLHKQFYNVHSIGWDIAFLPTDVCFIEGNDNWHVIDTQFSCSAKGIFDKYFR